MAASYDRAAESLGNILHMEHVNLMVPEQLPAIVFYISGLGYTRDPYLMVGLDNMWVNMGRSQMHLPRRDPSPQRLRGTVGMVSPDLDDVEKSLGSVAERLAGTKFSFTRKNDCIEATCPWGNHIRVHAPAPEYGAMQIGMPYVELNAPVGSAEAIARFYREIMGANATVAKRNGSPCASVLTGKAQFLHFIETEDKQPEYDGHHVAIYIADFVSPYDKLMQRGLITMESDAHEWRFIDIVDVDSGDLLFKIEHEVRSATHPLYARPLVNRNPAQSNRGYRRGQDIFLGQI
jgi:predicted enzyme related to lactoylglutathione lyase